MKRRSGARIGGALLAVVLAGAAGGPHLVPASAAEAAPRSYQAVGVIREIKPADRTLVIRHEAIGDYMGAMTMPFTVKDPKAMAGLVVGDKVAFRLTVTKTDGWIDQIKVLEEGGAVAPPPTVPSVRRVRLVDELKEGDLLPDYPFVNELGRSIRLSQFKGQALGLTFIYTRCPYPTFCPRMSNNFAEACRRLAALEHGPTNWHLLSLSFDPQVDTPRKLRHYARSFDYDPVHWSFVTGAIIDIDAITEQFGVTFARDGQGFSHNVRTVVVDARGRVQHIYVGNEWKVEDFVTALVKAAGAPSSAGR